MGTVVISGFSDEISSDFDEQLRVVKDLGMDHICLRSADGKGVAEYTADEFAEKLWPRMQAAGVKLSSIGSPIGKVGIADDDGFETQKRQLDEICKMCKIAGCDYIRVFSFYIPEGEDPDTYRDEAVSKMTEFAKIAERHDVVLIHENEKDIYGDVARRCKELIDAVNSKHLRAAFDFANFVQCGEDTAACWEMLRSYVSYIHIKDAVYTDNENVVFGTGDGKGPELLKQIIMDEDYSGYLTLEPHLVLFDSLASLETTAAENIIHENKAKDGAEGYAMQYHALLDILNGFGARIA